MEYIRLCRATDVTIDEDVLIRKLANELDNGAGDIDFIFCQDNNQDKHGTMLHFSISNNYERLAEYALSKGANISIDMTSKTEQLLHRNALEYAADTGAKSILEMLEKRSLDLYSSYGLIPFHLNCAKHNRHSEDAEEVDLEPANVNATVSTESPFWPGMTPILVAAKFRNYDLVKRLLDLGADPIVRDSGGNTPLHYLYFIVWFFDERLFILDGRVDTFGSWNGESHFHMACRKCPDSLSIVKRYLDQGISPNLPIRSLDCADNENAGKAGLHVSVEMEFGCTELTQLLLEYGADVDQEDSKGRIPLQTINIFTFGPEVKKPIENLCLLIENGSNQDKIIDADDLLELMVSNSFTKRRGRRLCITLLNCICRLITLDENRFFTKRLKIIYFVTRDELDEITDGPDGCWDHTHYSNRCSEELKTLSGFGLRSLLDDTIVLKPDFKNRFRWLHSFNFDLYPIYGRLLKTKFKRKLIQFDEKSKKISQVVPKVQCLFKEHGHLPELCAKEILWNLSDNELALFEARQSGDV